MVATQKQVKESEKQGQKNNDKQEKKHGNKSWAAKAAIGVSAKQNKNKKKPSGGKSESRKQPNIRKSLNLNSKPGSNDAIAAAEDGCYPVADYGVKSFRSLTSDRSYIMVSGSAQRNLIVSLMDPILSNSAKLVARWCLSYIRGEGTCQEILDVIDYEDQLLWCWHDLKCLEWWLKTKASQIELLNQSY
jgi:hypothetical protein